MKKILFAFILLLLSLNLLANGLSLNSPGPRALAMGGAFVAVANDGSAIYWNPAGLCGQPSGIKAILTDVIPIGNYSYGAFGIDADLETNHYFNPNLFLNLQMNRLALGLGIFVPAGLGAEYNGPDLQVFSAVPGVYPGDPDIEWMSKIGVINFAPAIAYQVTDNFSLGAAANIYYGMFDLKRLATVLQTGATTFQAFQYEEESTGLGYGATFGALYNAGKFVTLGLSVRTATTVTMDGEAKNKAMPLIAGSMQLVAPEKSDFEREVTWPIWVSGGIALHLHERFLLSFDAQYSKWSDLDILETDFDDDFWADLTGMAGEDEFVLHWNDAIQLRMGWEYKATDCFAIRGGYYYDPAPAPNSTLNILFPSMTNSVITGGLGYEKNNICLDFGLEYLFAMERTVQPSSENMPGTHKMDVFAYSLGIGYKF